MKIICQIVNAISSENLWASGWEGSVTLGRKFFVK